jgi:type VI secretion system secreted protein Hcp
MPEQTTTRRSLLAGGVAGTALGGLVLAPGDASAGITVPTGGSVAFFLDLDGIPGDSNDSEFPNTFELLDYSMGATTSVGPTRTGGARAKARPQDLSFTKVLDKASPKLFLACVTGKHIKTATLYVRKAGAPQPYLKIVLSDVYVSSYRSGPNFDDGTPLDAVTLDFATFEIQYNVQDVAGGPGRTVTAAFDFVTNKVIQPN